MLYLSKITCKIQLTLKFLEVCKRQMDEFYKSTGMPIWNHQGTFKDPDLTPVPVVILNHITPICFVIFYILVEKEDLKQQQFLFFRNHNMIEKGNKNSLL